MPDARVPFASLVTTLMLVVPVAASVSGCSDRSQRRLEDTTKATYDPATGRLKELTYDANKNGRIDTWTEMDGSRPLRARIDRNEDGRFDRWEYYDEQGQLTKVGLSRANDGKPDAWAFSGPDGRIQRIEISSTHDEHKIDRREWYASGSGVQEDRGPLLAVEEDANRDGKTDKWETYENGALKTVAFDENADGTADRRLTYRAGTVVLVESRPDGRGGFKSQVKVE